MNASATDDKTHLVCNFLRHREPVIAGMSQFFVTSPVSQLVGVEIMLLLVISILMLYLNEVIRYLKMVEIRYQYVEVVLYFSNLQHAQQPCIT